MFNAIFCLRNVVSEPSNSIIMNFNNSTLSPDCCHENAHVENTLVQFEFDFYFSIH